MSRRIEIELTSARPDGTWTWRAAGAREPKGELDGSVLPAGAKVGDVLRVDVDMDIDGITILAVLPPKGARKEPERLEIIGADRAFEPVTSTLVGRRDRGDRDRDRGPRRDRPDRPPRDGDRGDRRGPRSPGREGAGAPAGAGGGGGGGGGGGDRPQGGRPPRDQRERRERPPRPPVPMLPERPKPKRLRPGRAHRKALLEAVPDEQRPVAELVLRGGIPAVREAIKEQNEQLKAEGKPAIKPDGMLAMAEELQPRVRLADWLDRAEAALHDLDELDLRDLRSVVTAAADPSVAREESARDLAEKLREGLAVRQDKEHEEWLADIDAALGVGRVVRALRLSSRPPKAGVRFPTELGARLATAAGAALTADAAPDRWAAVLEAVAFSPIRGAVVPAGYPATTTDELKAAVTAVAGQVPEIAKHFGIEPPPEGSRGARAPRRPSGPKKSRPPGPKPIPAPPTLAATAAPIPSGETVPDDLVTDAVLDEVQAEAAADEVGALAAAELAEEAKDEVALEAVEAVVALEEVRDEVIADEAAALTVIDAVDGAEAEVLDEAESALEELEITRAAVELDEIDAIDADDLDRVIEDEDLLATIDEAEDAVVVETLAEVEVLEEIRAEAVDDVIDDEVTLAVVDEAEAEIAGDAVETIDALDEVEVEAVVDALDDEAVIAAVDDARADGA